MPVERRPTVERAWRAMGCDVSVVIVGERADLLDVAVARIADLEGRWSRFLPDSEVSEMNRRSGAPVKVTADTRLLVETSIAAWRATDGRFDPMVGFAVIAAGYDRTLADVQAGAPVSSGASAPSVGCAEVEVDAGRGLVTLPRASRFDPGGLGKGLAADLVTAELLAAGADGVCVDLGGDVRVAGCGPDVDDSDELGWTIGIADPFAPEPPRSAGDEPPRDELVACLADGAVATSSTLKRRWSTSDGGEVHHVIDPRTGRPSRSTVVCATVIAANGATAEALATAAIVDGADAAPLVEELGASALFVDASGGRTLVGPFEAFLVEPLPLEVRG